MIVKPGEVEDKLHAYATLHRSLLSFVRVLAPLAPYISEEIYRNLSQGVLDRESVHLCPFPTLEELEGLEIDADLEQAMDLFEEVILLGRGLRNDHGLKIRQPLQKLSVVYPSAAELEKLQLLDSYIADELNVKQIDYIADEEQFVTLTAKLNTRRLGKILGPKLGREGMQALHSQVQALSTERIREIERGAKLRHEDVEIGAQDILIDRKPIEGIKAAASSGQITVVLDTHLTQELRLEGLARDFVNRVQKLRKEFGFDVTDRIIVRFMTACPRLSTALAEHKDYVMAETLAIDLEAVRDEGELGMQGSSVHLPAAQEIDGRTIIISLTRMQG